jgi:predicted Zn-dependent protease
MRKYIFCGIVTFVSLGLIYANISGKKQDQIHLSEAQQYAKATEYINNNEFEQAQLLLVPLVEENPEQYEVVYMLGLTYSVSKDYMKAAPLLGKALALRPALYTDPQFTFRMGEVLFHLGYYDKAKEYFNQCRQLADSEQYYQAMAQLLALMENQ